GKLPANVVADFELWIKMGAPDPREGKATASYKTMTRDEARTFWAFQPVRKPAPPKVRDASWPRSDIDRFILARLEQKSIKPVGDAEKLTLLRRLHFDLVGLPASPEEQEAFLKDNSPQAVEKVVDALLASPAYGERWGRHWLDLARYAESNGNADNILFPHAWRYRDYVIRAFNADKPFDRFITEQVAGDLLPSDSPEQRDEHLIATGFLGLTSRPRAQNNPDYRMDLIADQIDVTSRAFLGLTVMCARCHDHKFDFIPTREYYALAGIFDSSVMVPGGGVKGAGKMGNAALHTLSGGGQAMGAREGRPADTQVCIRGETRRPGETVTRGFITIASPGGKAPAVSNRNQSGRMELAQWIASPDNPLTARVAVNRLWVHLFGEGIVRSVDNFGSLGEKPSHPELLDYLAARLVENGWSLKKTIREIVLSRTYQLASTHSAVNYKADPDNVLRWRMSPRRLEAEAIRDAILSVSGRLVVNPPARSLAAGAPGKKMNAKKAGMVAFDTNHRGVYLPILRNYLPEVLDLFDAANPSLVVGKREVTTVPAQALFLMNSTFATDNARAAADRLLAAPDLDDSGRVDLGYRLALGRPATAAERERALTFVRESAATLGTGRAGQVGAWSAFCQTLFASAEFRYVQ
ncbi:MAG: DUF1549 and DUF1553 domain-containing protein, partial [Gemmataceae bacterium]|nr:DUF1549 and DUF1553 domain-containing protein [Gemmataceae bacterium]